jgi:hypothetical protein
MSRGDPMGRKALFTPPVPGSEDTPSSSNPPLGKEALFSAGPRRRGTVVVECSRCLNHTRMTTIELGIRIAFLSLWIPGKRYSRWLQCPECERRTWCRIHWFG